MKAIAHYWLVETQKSGLKQQLESDRDALADLTRRLDSTARKYEMKISGQKKGPR